jgi:hypothetical protein
MVKQIFVNLAVKDLKKTKEFWGKLGFSFNPQFTDENNGCLVLGENIYAMLLSEKFFKTFIKREIADTSKTVEVLNGLQVGSKEEVDEIIRKAVEAGGTKGEHDENYEWMYGRGFNDLDGHHWDVFWMDISKVPKQ